MNIGSLVNALAGEKIMVVNEIREDDSRGRHTTTHRQLIMLPSGVIIIDTPGMRELGMWDVSTGLGEAFADVESYFGECRFSDCQHRSEPGCAIKEAIANGELPKERWSSYLQIKREAKFADDKAAQEQFFRYGFGLRCVDAIRGMDDIIVTPCEGYSFSEIAPKEILEVLLLENMLDESYIDSPFFMFREKETEAIFLKRHEHFQSVYFTAKYEGQIVAFVRAELDGENFICNTPRYLHVKGAYCLPEHRGKGLTQKLLGMLIQKLKAKGYTRLGVDFESLNPSAYGFWLKYFTPYSYSIVRRIDEWILKSLI